MHVKDVLLVLSSVVSPAESLTMKPKASKCQMLTPLPPLSSHRSSSPAATSEGFMLTEVMQRSRHVQPVLHGGSVKHAVSEHIYSQIHVTQNQTPSRLRSSASKISQQLLSRLPSILAQTHIIQEDES